MGCVPYFTRLTYFQLSSAELICGGHPRATYRRLGLPPPLGLRVACPKPCGGSDTTVAPSAAVVVVVVVVAVVVVVVVAAFVASVALVPLVASARLLSSVRSSVPMYWAASSGASPKGR